MRLCARLLKANTGQEALRSQGACGVKRRPLWAHSHRGSHQATYRHFLFRVYFSVSSPADSAQFEDPLVQRAITTVFPALIQMFLLEEVSKITWSYFCIFRWRDRSREGSTLAKIAHTIMDKAQGSWFTGQVSVLCLTLFQRVQFIICSADV